MPQTRSRVFDDFAKLMTDAAVLRRARAGGRDAGEEPARAGAGEHGRRQPRGIRGGEGNGVESAGRE